MRDVERGNDLWNVHPAGVTWRPASCFVGWFQVTLGYLQSGRFSRNTCKRAAFPLCIVEWSLRGVPGRRLAAFSAQSARRSSNRGRHARLREVELLERRGPDPGCRGGVVAGGRLTAGKRLQSVSQRARWGEGVGMARGVRCLACGEVTGVLRGPSCGAELLTGAADRIGDRLAG
jgi:hypothetical protein